MRALCASWVLGAILVGQAGLAAGADGEPGHRPEVAGPASFAGMNVRDVEVVLEGPYRREALGDVVVVQPGRPLSMQEVGRSIELLYRLGAIDDVVAEAESVEGGVRVRFRVWPSQIVRSVHFRGNRAGMTRRLREQLTLRAGSPYAWSQARLQAANLERFLQNEGFFQTQVDVETHRARKGFVDVVFIIRGGPQARVREVVFEGNKALSTRVLTRAVDLDPGSAFRPSGLEAQRRAVLDRCRRAGYLAARVKADYELDSNRLWATVRFQVEEGPRIGFEFWSYRLPQRGPLNGFLWYRIYQWLKGRRGESAPRELGWLRKRRWMDVLDLENERQYSSGFVEEANDRIRRTLVTAGFDNPTVTSDRVVDEESGRVTFKFVIDPGPKISIRSVSFNGQVFFDESMLRALFDEAMARFAPRGIYTAEALDSALALMADYYRSYGFLNVRMARRVHVEEVAGLLRATIHVSVDEGRRTLIRAVELMGCNVMPTDEVRAQIPIVPGEPYDPARIREAMDRVEKFYAEHGYVNALVLASRDAWQGDRTQVVVRFDVDEGARVRVGEVIVRGARRTRPQVIARELTVHSGDIYRPSAIEESRTRLRKTGLFQKASIYPVAGERVRDLMVDVQERKARVVALSAGFLLSGYDTSFRSAQFDTSLELTHYNLWGLGHRLSGRLDLATSYLPRLQERTPGEDPYQYAAELGKDLAAYLEQAANRRMVFAYQTPYLLGIRMDTIAQVTLFERKLLPTFLVHRNILGWGLSKDVRPHLNVSVQLQTSIRRLDAAQTEEVVQMWDVDREQRLFLQAGAVMVLDRRTSDRLPASGYLLNLQGEVTQGYGCGESWEGLSLCDPGQWQSEEMFARMIGSASFLLPILPWLGAEARLTLGYLASLRGEEGAIPVERRFYLGGAGTVRGFPQGSLGPQRFREKSLPAQVVSGWTSVPTGGNLTASYTLEALFELEYLGSWFEDLELALFHDAGNVFWVGPAWTRYQQALAQDQADPELQASAASACLAAAGQQRLRYSTGTGLRWRTGVGMIRFDIGFPLARLCSLERPWAAHLSIGVY